ncbi:MAG TPA: hypothetical protein VE404_09465, partial [Verrucomicrobiae bacterium]|nr:hypothetical protein [Verrucomicrobiae bacterium]
MTHTPWTIALALVATLGFMTTSAAALGPEFQVNTYTSGDQYQPAVAMDPSGSGFVVAWTGDGLGYAHNGVFAQRLDSSGMKLGTEFRLSGFTANVQFQPSIAFRSAGEFVVVWTSDGQDGSGTTVMGRLFDSTGMSQGSEFRVNTYTTGGQQRASVASNAAGDFVVVWEGDLEDGSYRGVFGQRFDSAGATVGGEFQVNTYTTGYQYFPAIGGDGTGAFVVTWTSVGQDGDQGGVFAQRLDSDGSPAGSEFRVSTNTAGRQATASVAPDGSGGFVVAWMDAYQDGDYAGVFAQRFDSDGDPVGTEFQVNTYTTSFQSRPAVAQNGAGFVVAWSSYGQDGEYAGVFG